MNQEEFKKLLFNVEFWDDILLLRGVLQNGKIIRAKSNIELMRKFYIECRKVLNEELLEKGQPIAVELSAAFKSGIIDTGQFASFMKYYGDNIKKREMAKQLDEYFEKPAKPGRSKKQKPFSMIELD